MCEYEYSFNNEINKWLDPLEYTTKEGDIKVDSHEFKVLLSMFGQALDMLNEAQAGQSTDRTEFLEKAQSVECYMKEKYLLLGSLRKQQKIMYDILQKIQNNSADLNMNAERIEECKNYILEQYLDFKMKRENLQKELTGRKEKLINEEII